MKKKIPFFSHQPMATYDFEAPLENPPTSEVLIFDDRGVLTKQICPTEFGMNVNGLFVGICIETSGRNGFLVLQF